MNYKEFKWGSHKPILQAIMEAFDPTGILELGCGNYSTKFLYSFNKPLTSIDTDKAWIKKIAKELPPRDNFKIIHHPFFDYKRSNKPSLIPDQHANMAIKFYKKFLSPEYNFLFIDHDAGVRGRTLTALYKYFDIIAFHDAEDKIYEYIMPNVPTYTEYIFNMFKPWTGVLLRTDLKNSPKYNVFMNKVIEYGNIFFDKLDKETLK